ncbi:mast cell-expressed membrane protein 1 isoform X2 [Ovis aries]|uniref:mast cell-expressed membrane protein 1 isoform X2 n=1 Tax=Ovis aries TaxID=9940 RepID=UPI001C2E0779|nr:mast cell-expressed membrane protein 1 isoform X2 [Ovis aries]
MQAVAFKDKRRGSAGNKAADDPNYENITFTFKNQNQPKGSHSPPKNKVPAESRPPSDTAQGHHWLPKAMMSLNTFLTLSCMVLLAVVLVKNSEMSRELVVLKEELWNVSTSVQEYQEEQKTQWGNVEQRVTAAKQSIDTVMRNVQEGNPKRRQLATGWGSGREQASNKAKSVPSQLFPVSPPLQSQTSMKSRKHYRKSSVY